MVDYTQAKFSKEFRKEVKDESPADTKGYWWNKDEAAVAEAVAATGMTLEQDGQQRHQSNLIYARLYGNYDLVGFGARDYSRTVTGGAFSGGTPNRITFNVVSSCTDTLNAKIGKGKPRPTVLTSGGSWKMQQKAKSLNKFLHGLFHETKVHNHAQDVRQDAYVFGTGALYVYFDEDDKICAERCFIDELFVDDADGVNGKPRQLLRRKFVDRQVALAVWGDSPEKQEAIARAKIRAEDKPTHSTTDLIEVWEAWHLRSGKNVNDSRHVIAIGGMAMVDEEWELDCFPFIFRKYRHRVRGFWGQGIAEILTGIQIALNRLVRSIDEQLRRKGKGRVFAPLNSIDAAQLDNSISPVVFYKGGVPPHVDAQSAVSQDEFAQVQQYYQKAFQEVGLSELSAQSKKPAGLDAAVALREFNDIETERFALDALADENMYMDFAELCLELIRKNGGKGYKVRLPNKNFVLDIDWKDIDLERDAYVMQMFPVSSLPSTPSARLQRVEELRQAGYIDMPTAKRLLDFPDIESEENLANAATDDVDACISMILDDATPTRPCIEPYQSLDIIINRATSAYLFAKHHNADEERLDMLRTYINQATAQKAQVIQTQAAMNAPPPNVPQPTAPAVGQPVPQ